MATFLLQFFKLGVAPTRILVTYTCTNQSNPYRSNLGLGEGTQQRLHQLDDHSHVINDLKADSLYGNDLQFTMSSACIYWQSMW